MAADLAAGYCGEPSVEAFLGRVGGEYPLPRVQEGRRRLWLKVDLDNSMGVMDLEKEYWDAAEVL